ncbi:MAG: hypothetical protein HY512_01230 [Candidatus Aenigmarchaeota archaeon]|nr:hypothetical protein [Candidatus Aenigmarchaeota archaeon]
MKRYIKSKLETDTDSVAGQRNGYTGSMTDRLCRYVSNLSTRAKVAVAVGSLVLAGFGANYILKTETPMGSGERHRGTETPMGSAGRNQRKGLVEALEEYNDALGKLVDASSDLIGHEAMKKEDQEAEDREARMKSIRDKLGELRGAFEEGGK